MDFLKSIRKVPYESWVKTTEDVLPLTVPWIKCSQTGEEQSFHDPINDWRGLDKFFDIIKDPSVTDPVESLIITTGFSGKSHWVGQFLTGSSFFSTWFLQ